MSALAAIGWPRLLAACLLLLAVVVSTLVPVDLGGSPIVNAIWDAGHFPLFGLLAVGLYLGLAPLGGVAYLLAGALALVAAVGIELIQPAFSRTASVDDLVRGALGVVVALVGVVVWRGRSIAARLVHAAVTVGIVGWLLFPAWLGWQAMAWRDASYPLLADFEDPIEMRLWFSQGGTATSPTAAWRSDEWAAHGSKALKVRKASGGWPGVYYSAGLMDWSPFERFSLEIYNPGPPFELRLRIDDADTRDFRTRFGTDLAVASGVNRIDVPMEQIERGPAEGSLDLRRIERFLLFTSPEDPPRVFFLDHVRLR